MVHLGLVQGYLVPGPALLDLDDLTITRVASRQESPIFVYNIKREVFVFYCLLILFEWINSTNTMVVMTL